MTEWRSVSISDSMYQNLQERYPDKPVAQVVREACEAYLRLMSGSEEA